ncbi:hypothetical protein GF318_03190 [Candidatus Micrarchaeota archaeon]|nr:hypothetical protein [Candidatus Micrarchaeota archaeon]
MLDIITDGMNLWNINFKWFIAATAILLFLWLLNLEILLYGALAATVMTASLLLVAFIIIGLAIALYFVLKSTILWSLWKRVSFSVPKALLERVEGKTLEMPEEIEAESAEEFEGKENALLAAFSLYAVLAAGAYLVARFPAEKLMADIGLAILLVFLGGVFWYSLYFFAFRLIWVTLPYHIFRLLYEKITGKKVGYSSAELKEQKKEIEGFYKKTIKALGDRFYAYRNLERDLGLVAAVRNTNMKMLFDLDHLRRERKRKQKKIIKIIPVYRITAFFPNKRGVNGAIRYLIAGKTDVGGAAASAIIGSEIDYSPNLELEANLVEPIFRRLVFEDGARLEDREDAPFRQLAIIYQKKGIMVNASLRSDFRQKDLKNVFKAIKDIHGQLS